MMFNIRTVLLGLSATTAVNAHMRLWEPPALRGDNNPHTIGDPDPRLNYPYNCCGRTNEVELCRGYLKLLGTPEGAPVADWPAGSKQKFSLSGHKVKSSIENPEGGTHSGGSGQIGFSIDKGKTFKAVKTWQGAFPGRHASGDPSLNTFEFTVPDLPTGEAIFMLSWINREKEFYNSCSIVSIISAGSSTNPPDIPASPPIASPPIASPPIASPPIASPPIASPPIASPPIASPPIASPPTGPKTCDGQAPAPVTVTVTVTATPTSTPKVARRGKAEFRNQLSELHGFSRRATPFQDLPDMLIVDVDRSECAMATGELHEMLFPDPGPDVVMGDNAYPLKPPVGPCKGASAPEYHTGKQPTQG